MSDVFIGHVEEDAEIAAQIAGALEAGGYTTWHAERHDDGAAAAIDRCKAFIVLVSPDSLGSSRVTAEVVRGYESGKPFIPVLISMTHVEFTARQPEWRAAIGAATSIEVPPAGVTAIIPRILEGVATLTAPAPRRPLRSRIGSLRRWQRVGIAAVVVAGIAGGAAAWIASRGGEPASEDGTRRSETVIPRSTESFVPGPLADSATTPLQTVAGRLRITEASLTSQVCSRTFEQGCKTATGSDRLVVLTVAEWDGRDVILTDDLSRDMDRSYVTFGDRRATFTAATQDSVRSGSVRIVYASLPASAAQGDVRLAWPGSPTLTLHFSEG